MDPVPVSHSVNPAGPNMVSPSAARDVSDGANAIYQMTKAAVDELGFNKPGFIQWGKWLVGKLGPFGYVVTIVLSPVLIPASLTYDAGRGIKLLFRKIARVEEPVQTLLPMVAKQVEDTRELEQQKQVLESQNAEISDQLAVWKVQTGELKGLNDRVAHQGQKLNCERNRNNALNVLLERLAKRADKLEAENAAGNERYQALKVELDKQLAEKSLLIQQHSNELEAARQQHDQTKEDNIWARQAQADKICDLERKLAASQQQIHDTETRHQAKARTLAGQHQFALMEAEEQHRLAVAALEAHHQEQMQALIVQNENDEVWLQELCVEEAALQKDVELQDRLQALLMLKIGELSEEVSRLKNEISPACESLEWDDYGQCKRVGEELPFESEALMLSLAMPAQENSAEDLRDGIARVEAELAMLLKRANAVDEENVEVSERIHELAGKLSPVEVKQ